MTSNPKPTKISGCGGHHNERQPRPASIEWKDHPTRKPGQGWRGREW